jgi:hypothetical protein
VTANAKLCAVLLNVAVMFGAAVTVKVHVVLVPLQRLPALDQPPNALPAAGVAVNVTLVPGANCAVQVPAQLIPAGLDVTVPVPAPARTTATCGRVTMIPSPEPARAASVPGPAA